MCVAITLEPGVDLTLDEITKMDRANADGVGMAWVEDHGVAWWKTIKVNPEEVLDHLKLTNYSRRLLHFRYATVGGVKDELCHPFDISPESVCTPTGLTDKVMIHNGHWHRWSDAHKLLQEEDLLPDKGPWSDTRLAAYLAHTNEDWLIAIGGRVATLDKSAEMVRRGDWDELRDGIYVSNKGWQTATTRRGGYPGYKGWQGWGDDQMITPPDGYGGYGGYCNATVKTPITGTKHGEAKAKKGSSEERRFLEAYPSAFWNQEKKTWCAWDNAARTMVQFTP